MALKSRPLTSITELFPRVDILKADALAKGRRPVSIPCEDWTDPRDDYDKAWLKGFALEWCGFQMQQGSRLDQIDYAELADGIMGLPSPYGSKDDLSTRSDEDLAPLGREKMLEIRAAEAREDAIGRAVSDVVRLLREEDADADQK